MEKEDLIRYFNENLFIPNLKAHTKEECLVELVQKFEEQKLIKSPEIVLEMLRKRETLGSTGIGKGIAIPHGRTTAAKDVMIAFAKSEEGIDYEAMDGKPVHFIFMVIAPPQEQSNIYLPVLGKLVEVLNNGKNRKRLKKVETFQELEAFFKEA
ncbi:MAG: PTS sugar transporter subunit IIA [candidate division KSB1 bacterium]|nr:PTS sugar transporter subunit IIA [candidate division KSB1 bacterium]